MKDLRLPSEEEGMTEDIFAGILTTLVEAIHVKLPDERVDISMPEIFGQDLILKIINLFDGELPPICHPMNDGLIVLIVKDIKTLLDEICN